MDSLQELDTQIQDLAAKRRHISKLYRKSAELKALAEVGACRCQRSAARAALNGKDVRGESASIGGWRERAKVMAAAAASAEKPLAALEQDARSKLRRVIERLNVSELAAGELRERGTQEEVRAAIRTAEAAIGTGPVVEVLAGIIEEMRRGEPVRSPLIKIREACEQREASLSGAPEAVLQRYKAELEKCSKRVT